MKLLEPGKIGNITLKNRVVMSAMNTMQLELDGRMSQRDIEYYTTRARGGTGLIITGGIFTREIEQLPFAPLTNVMLADCAIYTNRLSDLAESIHDYGAKVAAQFQPGWGHNNFNVDIMRCGGAVSVSAIPAALHPSGIARELTTREIENLILAYRAAAEVIRNAGIDAVEINAHGGYLGDEFLTPLWNQRTDKYGGDMDGRMTFFRELIESIRKGAGRDFPIIVKYALTHYFPGGRTIEEGIEIAKKLEEAGASALSIDAGSNESMHWQMPPTTQPPGCMTDLSSLAKKAVKIPVIALGKLHYPEVAEKALVEGKADFIAMGKGMLADPEWVNKVKAGRLDEIRPCLGDHEGCLGRIYTGKSVSCTVNPACGMEKELAIVPSKHRKSVLVVGGGPAGMEAAIVCAMRGFRVTLAEKQAELGGNLIPAAVPDFKSDYQRLRQYLTGQIRKTDITVNTRTEVTAESVRWLKPDAVIVATGSQPLIPAVPGINGPAVFTSIDLLRDPTRCGRSVLMVGGGLVGCETALFLAQKERQVTVVEMLPQVAGDMMIPNRIHLLELMDKAGIKILTGCTVTEIEHAGALIADEDGNSTRITADTIALACGFTPVDTLLAEIQDLVPEVYAVGDCVEPRNIMAAIREGYRVSLIV